MIGVTKRGGLGIAKQMAAIITLVVIVVVLGALLAYVSVSKPSKVTVTPVTSVVCPAHPDQKLVVYFISHGSPTDPFWIPVIEAAVYAGHLFNMTVIYEAPSTFSISEMVELAQSALAAKPSGLIITVPSGTAFEPIIREAYSDGIPVIVVNVVPPPGSLPGFPYNETLGYVGQYDYDAGVGAAQYMIQWYEKTYGKPPTNIVIFNHEPGLLGLTLRIEGVENEFKASGINATINVIPISLNYAESLSIIESYLEAHPNTQLMVTLGPAGTDPAVAAVKDLNLQGKVYIMAFDIDNVTIQGIENGTVIGTVDQQPFAQGFMPVVETYLYLCYGIAPPYNVTTGPFILNKQTVQLYQYQLQAVSELSPYLKAITG